MAKLLPVVNNAQFINGEPAVGAKLFFYAAGSSTKQTTYADEAGLIPQTNPIILDSRGEPSQPVWGTEGLSYKIVFTASTDSDPPASPIWDIDDVTGINDASLNIDQWVDSGVTPTYVSATQFTLPGDQTSAFHNKRRIKVLITAGTAYGTILSSVFGALTTVTVVMDTTPLDSGLSSIQLGLLTYTNPSIPSIVESSRATVAATATTTPLWASTAQVQDWTGTPTITDFPAAPKAGAWRVAYPAAGTVITDNAAIDVQGDANYTTVADDQLYIEAITTSTFKVLIRKKNGQALSVAPAMNYIAGYTLSTAGSSATMSIAAGQAADSANAVTIPLAAAISKTTAAWAVGTGNGGLDTGAIANNTWYHFYAIRRPDTGVVDVIFSTNASLPTLPASYTQYRRIGSGRTNGSAQWVKFVQFGDLFLWDAAVIDVDATNPGTAAVTRTLTTPLGIKTRALITVGILGATSGPVGAVISSLDVSDQAGQAAATAALSGFTSSGISTNTANWGFMEQEVMTNTSSQVRSRLSVSGANDRLGLITRGWTDTRGKDA
jgi:hypothetical protein